MAKRLLNWIDERFPLTETWNRYAAKYYAPRNLNFWYIFGAFSLVVLINQVVTGVWLTMYYVPTGSGAFDSVQHIMRNVKFGWLIRYMHTTGASAFFVVLYLHIYRAFIYGSYRKPRELIWLIGMFLYVCLMAEAFTGYVLPWGQMSFWAAKVIINLFNAIPYVGHYFAQWIQGDYSVTGNTLHRFFAYHVSAIPMTVVLLVIIHIVSLHKAGSNNPEGIEIRNHLDDEGKPVDSLPFHPYFTVKDIFGIAVFLIIFSAILFFWPTMGGHFLEPENFMPANPMKTPAHIVPVWYLAPFYAILRAVPNKTWGIMAMAAGISILFVMPWLDKSPVKSIRYKGWISKTAITLFVISFIGLGYMGTRPPTTICTFCARIFSAIYFAFFFLMPIYTRLDKCKPEPDRIE